MIKLYLIFFFRKCFTIKTCT